MAKVSGGGSRIVFGVVLILVGVLLMLSHVGWFSFGELVQFFWPLALIVIGLWQWATRRFRASFWPLLLIVLGVFFLLLNLGLLDGRTFGVVIGAVMIGFGIWLVIRKARPRTVQAVSSADGVDHWIMFGGVEEELTTQQFNGGNVTAIFGGADLDLRHAGLAEGESVLNCTTIFGGIDIRVPESWDVIVDGTAILGGVDDKTARSEQPDSAEVSTRRLRIDGTAIFGGIEVKH